MVLLVMLIFRLHVSTLHLPISLKAFLAKRLNMKVSLIPIVALFLPTEGVLTPAFRI